MLSCFQSLHPLTNLNVQSLIYLQHPAPGSVVCIDLDYDSVFLHKSSNISLLQTANKHFLYAIILFRHGLFIRHFKKNVQVYVKLIAFARDKNLGRGIFRGTFPNLQLIDLYQGGYPIILFFHTLHHLTSRLQSYHCIT